MIIRVNGTEYHIADWVIKKHFNDLEYGDTISSDGVIVKETAKAVQVSYKDHLFWCPKSALMTEEQRFKNIEDYNRRKAERLSKYQEFKIEAGWGWESRTSVDEICKALIRSGKFDRVENLVKLGADGVYRLK